MGRTRTRTKGSMNVAGTKKWDGTKWVPVNVARDGQRATLNGKPVVRKGGKWTPVKSSTRTTNRRSSSGNKPTPPKTTPPKATPLKTIPDKDRPKDMQAGKVYGDAGQPPAPKLPPKPKPTPTRTPVRSGAASTRSGSGSRPSGTTDPQKMDANYKAWAKANPSLAKKVKKGQAGYNAINNKPTKTKPSVPANRGAGNGAPGAQIRRTEPATPKKAKSALETAAEKRKKQKKSAANRAGWQGNRNY